MTYRISQAVAAALGAAQPRPVRRVRGIRSEFAYKVRRFDEAADEKAVVAYCSKRIKDPAAAKFTIDTFRDMRKELALHQGEERKTWVQAITIGDTAVVGVPGEFFTVLGEDIKRRSPFRYTYVFELSNDYVGYIADRKGYELGGYQTWTGLHKLSRAGNRRGDRGGVGEAAGPASRRNRRRRVPLISVRQFSSIPGSFMMI